MAQRPCNAHWLALDPSKANLYTCSEAQIPLPQLALGLAKQVWTISLSRWVVLSPLLPLFDSVNLNGLKSSGQYPLLFLWCSRFGTPTGPCFTTHFSIPSHFGMAHQVSRIAHSCFTPLSPFSIPATDSKNSVNIFISPSQTNPNSTPAE